MVNWTQRANYQLCKPRPQELGHPAPPLRWNREKKEECWGWGRQGRQGRGPEMNNQIAPQGPGSHPLQRTKLQLYFLSLVPEGERKINL